MLSYNQEILSQLFYHCAFSPCNYETLKWCIVTWEISQKQERFPINDLFQQNNNRGKSMYTTVNDLKLHNLHKLQTKHTITGVIKKLGDFFLGEFLARDFFLGNFLWSDFFLTPFVINPWISSLQSEIRKWTGPSIMTHAKRSSVVRKFGYIATGTS